MTLIADIFDPENMRIGGIFKIGERYRIEWTGEDPDLPIKSHIISRILYNSLELAEKEVYRLNIVNRVTRRGR